ncbi:uncharacterized protein LOC135828727 [Sycon ciliatum]|uniref:uncharacterized protein LOC135828727 n=1 Tax=Sycon ciliatum TaxID=27933 RepID=UPI0031F66C34
MGDTFNSAFGNNELRGVCNGGYTATQAPKATCDIFGTVTVMGKCDTCNPRCTGGLMCGNGTTCQYVMVHTPNQTSISMQHTIQSLEADVEYYDQVAGEWFETHNFTVDLFQDPIRILMKVGHQGTYFRSRINMYVPECYTISLTTTGTPPTGYPVYTWPMFPFAAYDTKRAAVTLSLPTVNPTAKLSVQIGLFKGASTSITTSTSTVTLTNVRTTGRFYFRMLSLASKYSSSSAYTQKVFFQISPLWVHAASFYRSNYAAVFESAVATCSCFASAYGCVHHTSR